MKFTHFSLAVVAITPCSNMVYAEPIDLGELEIVESTVQDEPAVQQHKAADIYKSYDPIDSGKSVIGKEMISQSQAGDNDTTRLIQDLPNVQIDIDQEEVSLQRIQSVRPSDFSISGGATFENNIMIDGIGVNSVQDTLSNSFSDDDQLEFNAGVTAQSVYVDPSLLESAEVMDSNVSAKYGQFLGGAVNYKIRTPSKQFHMNMSGGYQADEMVHYKRDNSDMEEGEEPSSKPNFYKYNGSISFDLPLTENLLTLVSYSRSASKVTYTNDETYGGDNVPNRDISENYLIKGVYTYSDNLSFTGQLIYSPYIHQYTSSNVINSFQETSSSGMQGYIAAEGYQGLTTWNSKFSITTNDSSRDAADTKVRYVGSSVDWCSKSNCYEGSLGDLDFLQKDYRWSFDMTTPLWSGDFRWGADLSYTQAERNRPNDVYSYTTSKKWTGTCEDGDITCNGGSIGTGYTYYPANFAEVTYSSQALWLEYERQIANVNIRAGLRGEHNEFLNNYNVAPRLTVNWEFLTDTYLTIGANRYYANNMVSYALRSQDASTYAYKRTVNSSTGEVSDWALKKTTSAYLFDTDTLKTPYSDELTAALTFPTPLQGNLRLKTVYRQNRDRFSVSDTNTGTDYYRNMENEGKSDYLAYTLEWSGGFEHHRFNANVTWSETHYFGQKTYTGYEDTSDEVYYKGSVMTTDEINELSDIDNYAAPIKASIGWSADWFNRRLVTNTKVNYRGSYSYIGDSQENIEIDSSTYDVYEDLKKESFLTMDLNLLYKLINSEKQQLNLKASVKNVFDSSPNATTSEGKRYQTGRTLWLGFNYAM